MNINEIFEVVKSKYKDAVLNDGYIKYNVITDEEGCAEFSKIKLKDNKICVTEYFDNFPGDSWELLITTKLYEVENNVIELKHELDVEITFEDIKENFKDKGQHIKVCTELIKITTGDCDIIYYKKGLITVYNTHIQGYFILFENLSMYELYKQIKLKIDNINKNIIE